MQSFTIPDLVEPQLLGRSFARFFVVHRTGRYGAYLPDQGSTNQFGLLVRSGAVELVTGHNGWRFLPRLSSDEGCYPYYHGDYLDLGGGRTVFVDVTKGILRTTEGQVVPVSKSYLSKGERLLGNHWEG